MDSTHHHLVAPVAEAASGGLLGVGVTGVVLQLSVAGGHLGIQAVGEVVQDTHAVLHGLRASREQLSSCPAPTGSWTHSYPDQSEHRHHAPSVWNGPPGTLLGPGFESCLYHCLAV